MKPLKIYKNKKMYGRYSLLCGGLVLFCLYAFTVEDGNEQIACLWGAGFFALPFAYMLYNYLDRRPFYIISDKGIFSRRDRTVIEH
jgi:hypothetical protein